MKHLKISRIESRETCKKRIHEAVRQAFKVQGITSKISDNGCVVYRIQNLGFDRIISKIKVALTKIQYPGAKTLVKVGYDKAYNKQISLFITLDSVMFEVYAHYSQTAKSINVWITDVGQHDIDNFKEWNNTIALCKIWEKQYA